MDKPKKPVCALRKEGYEQRFGESDASIRQNLGLKANEGKVGGLSDTTQAPTSKWLVVNIRAGYPKRCSTT